METAFESFKKNLFELQISGQDSIKGAIFPDPDKLDVQAALALKNIYFYLGLVFRYPTETIYSEIKAHLAEFESFFADYGGAVPQLPPIAELQSEYISLFVTNKGSVPAVPYASCYQGDGMLMSEDFFKLQQLMTASGFRLDESAKELEDHLAVLLEFCSSLLNKLAQKNHATEQNTGICIAALMEISYRFIQPWIGDFTGKINSYANYDFYKLAGNALKSLFDEADTIYIQLLGFCNNATNELQG
jgi:putative dimethyl sulfoxide reductase chaperone